MSDEILSTKGKSFPCQTISYNIYDDTKSRTITSSDQWSVIMRHFLGKITLRHLLTTETFPVTFSYTITTYYALINHVLRITWQYFTCTGEGASQRTQRSPSRWFSFHQPRSTYIKMSPPHDILFKSLYITCRLEQHVSIG